MIQSIGCDLQHARDRKQVRKQPGRLPNSSKKSSSPQADQQGVKDYMQQTAYLEAQGGCSMMQLANPEAKQTIFRKTSNLVSLVFHDILIKKYEIFSNNGTTGGQYKYAKQFTQG